MVFSLIRFVVFTGLSCVMMMPVSSGYRLYKSPYYSHDPFDFMYFLIPILFWLGISLLCFKKEPFKDL